MTDVAWSNNGGEVKVTVNYADVANKLKNAKFNAVRVPFSFDVFWDPTGKQRMQELVKALGAANILVLFDCHNVQSLTGPEFKQTPYFSLTKANQPIMNTRADLGPSKQIDAEIFGKYWVEFLDTMGAYANVYGIDIYNEPHGEQVGWNEDNKPIKYNEDCEKIIAMVLAKHPHIVVYVEGTSHYKGKQAQWGAMLMGAMDKPLNSPANKFMYAPTCYGPDLWGHKFPVAQDTSLFGGTEKGVLPLTFPENMDAIWDSIFGGKLIGDKGIMIKEWGGHMGFRHVKRNPEYIKAGTGLDLGNSEVIKDALNDAKLQSHLVRYIKKHDLDSFYWAANGMSASDVGALWSDMGAGDPEPALWYAGKYDANPETVTKLDVVMKIMT
jgi:aryl-phospho-beta-D-glucosidase BglC (GH1 family)